MHVKHYIKSQKQDLTSPFKRRMIQACKALGIKENNPKYGDLIFRDFRCGHSMLKWLLNQPDTETVTLKTYLNMADLTEIQSVDLTKNGNIGLVLEFKEHKFLLDILMVIDSSSSNRIEIDRSYLTAEHPEFLELELEKALLYEYTKSLNFKESLIFFDAFGSLYTKPRRKVLENINQFDTKDLIQEMIEVLNKKRKRAYAFIGRQGVGKSSILRVIEEQMTDYMIFHLLPEDFEHSNRIRLRFDVIKMFQPAIVMIEDIDACGIKEKNATTGAFLNSIDEINKDLNIILLATINDTDQVHHTILNRPGRFDRVIEISPPTTIQESYQVVLSKIKALKSIYCKDMELNILGKTPSSEMEKSLKLCLDKKFTQAELTLAVAEQTLIDLNRNINGLGWKAITLDKFDKSFASAVLKHLKTKEVLQNYRFSNAIDNSNSDTPQLACDKPSSQY